MITAIKETTPKELFVQDNSIVKEIWGSSDTILFIFAGSAAEFALNKAVDWLYFTGRLPADPLGRLFSTVSYARDIVFSDNKDALKAIDTIAAIHKGVESKRGYKIPDWAYRDVLFMLIDYSVRAYEILRRKLTVAEKEEVFDVFNRIGLRMGIPGLPSCYSTWVKMRSEHLSNNLERGNYTEDLFEQYKKHLKPLRYFILLQVQKMIVPSKVAALLKFNSFHFIKPVLWIYKLFRSVGLGWFVKSVFLPEKYKTNVKDLDAFPSHAK